MRDPARPELHRAREWSAALAAALDGVAEQLDVAARRVTAGWTDAHAAEWTDRLIHLRRTLEREAAAAGELGRVVDRAADEEDLPGPDADPYGVPTGARLGGTDARRAADVRGVRIPRWDEPDAGSG